MKAGQVILIIFVILLLAVGVSGFLLVKNLDRLAAEALDEAGDELLKSGISLESAKVGLLDGTLNLSGFTISNPEGFSGEPVLSVGSIKLDVDLRSLDDELVVVESIEIRDPRVIYEINAQGDSNIDMLQRRLDEEVSRHSRGNRDKRLIIERLDFKGGTVTARSVEQPGKELVFDFPAVSLSDLGGPDGAPPDQVGEEIADELMAQITRAAKQAGVDQLVDAQKDRLREKAEEKLKDLLNRGG